MQVDFKITKKTNNLLKLAEEYGAHNHHPLPVVIT